MSKSNKNTYGALSTFFTALLKNEDNNDTVSFYRGVSDCNYEDIPAIYRVKDGVSYINKEHIIFREALTKSPRYFLEKQHVFEKLVMMQHYGLPTRLLDLTENPLVALYFACCANYGKGGKTGLIRRYQIPKTNIKYYDDDDVSAISNLSKCRNDFSIADIENEVRKDIVGFSSKIDHEVLNQVLLVKPLLNNNRIIRQQGVFMLFGSCENKRMSNIDFDEVKIIDYKIANNGKSKIINQLEMVSITEADLFPEIDNITRQIRRKLEKDLFVTATVNKNKTNIKMVVD